MVIKDPIYKYIIKSSELFKKKDSTKVKIIDCRWYLNKTRKGEIEYKNSHISGAIFFDVEKLSDSSSELPHMLPPSKKFNDFAQKNGINLNDEIIIYDQEGYFCSTRVWFTFRLFGFKKVKILDGGFKEWYNQKLPLTNKIKKTTSSDLRINSYESDKIINKVELENHIVKNNKKFTLIDARPEDRFFGRKEEPRPNLKKGKINQSINIPFTNILTNGSYLKNLNELKDLMFSRNKINKSYDIICYCGSGITACNIIFVLTILGCKKIKLYDGSWAEWGKKKSIQN